MAENTRPKLGFVIVAGLMMASLAVLNLGTANSALSTECEPTGSGGGGGGTGSPSPSPSDSEEPFPPSFPPSLPPIIPGESESPSASPSESEGSPRRCDSEITIGYKSGNSEFAGAVRSDENECESGRRVTLKKKRPGPDQKVGQTVTNQRGRWEIRVPDAKGRYYAKTPKQSVTSDEGRVVCGGARSATEPV